jgi:hypothetical protein
VAGFGEGWILVGEGGGDGSDEAASWAAVVVWLGSSESVEGKAIMETLTLFESFGEADLRVYCIGANALPVAGGDGGGEGREEDARARLED